MVLVACVGGRRDKGGGRVRSFSNAVRHSENFGAGRHVDDVTVLAGRGWRVLECRLGAARAKRVLEKEWWASAGWSQNTLLAKRCGK